MKPARLFVGDEDRTADLAEEIVAREEADYALKAVEQLYLFLKSELAYSDQLALAASGYVPPLD